VGAKTLEVPGEIFYMLVDKAKGAAFFIAGMISVGRIVMKCRVMKCRRDAFQQEGHGDADGKGLKKMIYCALRHFLQVPYSTVLRALILKS
jgi:hypothetical protein